MSFGSTKNIAPEKPRFAGFQNERVATHESARVLPYFAGTRWLGVTWIGDPFNVRTRPIRRKIGKKKKTVGYDYYADFAALVCNGPVDRITKIKFDGDLVWSGTVDRGDEQKVSLTVESRGTIHFYWGTELQTLDSILSASGQNFTAMRGQCYLIGDDILLGEDGRLSNIELELRRSGSPPTSWYTAPRLIGNDANPITVLWELWTNHRYGAGRAETDLDTAKLASAATTLNTEGLGISPLITTEAEFRRVLTQLLENFDGYPTSDDGKFGISLVRDPVGTVPSIGDSDLITDPSISTQQWVDTFDEVRVKFKNYEKDGNDDVAKHHDRANFTITGKHRSQNVDRPWITSQTVAAKIAGNIGRVSGLPQAHGRLRLRESSAASITLGAVFDWTTRDSKTLRLRCVERIESEADRRLVEIGFETDRSWAMSTSLFTPSADTVPSTPTFSPSAPYGVRILDAPYAFSDQRLASLVWMVARNETRSTSYDVWKAPEREGPYSASSSLRSNQFFENWSVRAKLTSAYSANTLPIDDLTGIAFQVLSPDQDLLDDAWTFEDALNHELLAFIGPTATEIVSLFDVVKTGSDTYTAKCVRGLYDTMRRSHAINAEMWLQLRVRVDSYAWPPFSEERKFYKFQPQLGQAEVALANLTAEEHVENGRALRPLAVRNLRVNGDGEHPTWTSGNDITVSWSNTSRARSVFGLAFAEAPETDLTGVELELRSYDGVTHIDTTTVSPTGEQTTLTSAYLVSKVNDHFSLRAYGVRHGFKSLDYDEVFVRKV